MAHESVLLTKDLTLANGVSKPDIVVPSTGLTLLNTARESASTMWAMALSGRMKHKDGEIYLDQGRELELLRAKQLHHAVALAGVPQVDSLERGVHVRTVVREQAAWASPWYSRVPRDITKIDSFVTASSALELDIDGGQTVGSLSPYARFKLRVALALMARPEASLLIVDDVDQLRSMELRAAVLARLADVATELPVLVFSANPDDAAVCDTVIHERGLPMEENTADEDGEQ